ncbi:MAG TPA: lytic transglycosylase domain-containing protein [bacterium]|nr:lytic transglycosylase domain-containing protein [bacterium]
MTRIVAIAILPLFMNALLGSTKFDDLIAEIGRNEGVPVELLLSMAYVESRFTPTAVSSAKAIGILQVKLSTAKGYVPVKKKKDLFDPRKNITAAARHLVTLKKIFGTWPRAVAAYFCGGGRVKRELQETGMLSPVCAGYVEKVEAEMWQGFGLKLDAF